MPHISQTHFRKMKNSYSHEVAMFLAAKALQGVTVTYGELSQKFGRTPRSWGDVLGGIAIRCREADIPILSTIVVNANSGRPSEDALLYIDLGLDSPERISEEHLRCFTFDWRSSRLAPREA